MQALITKRIWMLCMLSTALLLAGCAGLRSDAPSTQAKIMQFYKNWQGTPYRLGGNNRAGIDCSALVQHGMAQVFGVKMPRTTKQQAKIGSRVLLSSRQPGDLVFFKTGWRQRHVGIYIGDDRFVHASSSKGVIISSLNNPYWKKHYWKTRRI